MDYMQIQLRNDTAAAWTAANPVLARGELGVEIDTFKVKMGDGALPWNDLPYLRGTGTGGAEVDWGDIVGSISSNAALTEALSGKVDAVVGKGLSTEDYTAEEREKLAGLPDDLSGYQAKSEKGKANGYAPLGPDGMLPESMYMRGGDGETYLETAFRVAMVAASSVTVDPSVVNGVAVGNVIAAGDTIKVAGEKYTVAGVSAVGTVTTIALEEAPATSVVGESIRVMARGNVVPLASETIPGLAKRATAAEVSVGTNDTAFVSPLLLPRDFGRIKVGGATLQADALNALFEIEAGDGINISVDTVAKKIRIASGSNVNPDVDAALSRWIGTGSGYTYGIYEALYSSYHNKALILADLSSSGTTRVLQASDFSQVANLNNTYASYGFCVNPSNGLIVVVGSNRYQVVTVGGTLTNNVMTGLYKGVCFVSGVEKYIAVGGSGTGTSSNQIASAPADSSPTPGTSLAWTYSSGANPGLNYLDCKYIPWANVVLAVGINCAAVIDPSTMVATSLPIPAGNWGFITLDDSTRTIIVTSNTKKGATYTTKAFCWTRDLTNWVLVPSPYYLNIGYYSPKMRALVIGIAASLTGSVGVSYDLSSIIPKPVVASSSGSTMDGGYAIYDDLAKCFYTGINPNTGGDAARPFQSLAYNP